MYAVLDNIIIIILTIISLFANKSPGLFIIAAGLLMVLTTYESFREDQSRTFFALEVILMTLFAVLSGGFAGFIVFFLLKEVREYIRIFLGVCLFLSATWILYKDTSFAMCIVKTLLLVTVFLFLMLIYDLMERIEKRKVRENEKLTASNISECMRRD